MGRYTDRWDYIKQSKGILKIKNQLSLAEFKLLFTLFEVNNEQGRREVFKIDNASLGERAGMDSKNIIRVRRPLKEKGLVSFEPGKKGIPTAYKIKILYEDLEANETGNNEDIKGCRGDTEKTKIRCHNDTQKNKIGCHDDTKGCRGDTEKYHYDTEKVPKALRGKPSETCKSIVKECKRDSRRKKQVFSPPTLEDVRAYVQEKNLPIDPKYFYDYFTAGDWHDSNGKQVRSWKQKALTWARHSKQEPSPSMASIEKQREWQQEEEKRQLAYIKSLGAKT